MNKIEIHRPYDSRGAFDADEHAGRELIFEVNLPQLRDNEYFGAEVAEQIFHTLNAPEEMLTEVELNIAKDFRSKKHYSLSTGDIVVVDGEHFLCVSLGWKKLENPIYPLINHA